MSLMLTLVPIAWAPADSSGDPPEVLIYTVEGLPANENAVISMRPGGWRVVRNALIGFDQRRLYASAEEASAALKAWIERGGQSTRAGE